ncbi:hypothetical protein ACFQ3L_01065 [Lacticaseibacillus jixianensis]|uniref:DUF4811 domain-containing protein n=1 Tax=Lacticaseibacillus jixianensis TaxID=2486012 RepID=A0ABW4B587_9LACO|nr:hypothetical protein [Lacticaseibacillus jixianensis]
MIAARILIILGLAVIIAASVALITRRRAFLLPVIALLSGFLLFAAGLLLPYLHAQPAASPQPPTQSSPKAKSAKKPAASSSLPASKAPALSQAAVTSLNARLAHQLTIDQGLAKGTGDSHGQATASGTPDHRYDWTMYVTVVTIDDQRRVTGQVSAFKLASLVKEARLELAERISHLALTVLREQKLATAQDEKTGLFTMLAAHQEILVQSRNDDYAKFQVK